LLKSINMSKKYTYNKQEVEIVKELTVKGWVQIKILTGHKKGNKMPVEFTDLK